MKEFGSLYLTLSAYTANEGGPGGTDYREDGGGTFRGVSAPALRLDKRAGEENEKYKKKKIALHECSKIP